MHGAGVGAGDDDEVGIAAGLHCRADFGDEFVVRDDVLAIQMTATFGRHLVFDVNGCHAPGFKFTHRARHIEFVAIAGVCIGNQRHANGAGHHRRTVHHLAQGQQTKIRKTKGRRDTSAGHIDRGKASLLYQPRANGVIRAGGREHAGLP